VLTALPWHDPVRLADAAAGYAAAGVDRIVCALRYTSVDEYRRALDALATVL
jgi:hypothetical protein